MSGILDRAAGAPISWGVCEVPGWGEQLPPERVLGEMASIGLRAAELGPDGWLPTDPSALRDVLDRYGLRLVGGFHPVVLHVQEGLDERLEATTAYADRLAAGGSDVLVLAAAAAAEGYDEAATLNAHEWAVLADAVGRVVDITGERGLAVAVHPHYGTAIQTPGDIARFLEVSDAPLCLDTGHVLVGGGDPLRIAEDARGRIAHAHMKDADVSLAERVRAGELTYAEGVRAGMYRPLGSGDLDAGGIVRSLEESGYEGWFVLEQDTVLDAAPDAGEGPVAAATSSLEFLGRVAAEVAGTPAGQAGEQWAAQSAASAGREEVG
ncbi:MAG TPA: sugar phosphate isomerase/epimerase [Actinomycetota bacterium]|jgi:inosose dehydratase